MRAAGRCEESCLLPRTTRTLTTGFSKPSKGNRYLLTEMFRLTEQDLLALFERHGYDLVLLEGFKDSVWPKIEVVRKEISDTPVSFQPLAVVGDIPGADFGLEDAQALADWLVAQMPGL